MSDALSISVSGAEAFMARIAGGGERLQGNLRRALVRMAISVQSSVKEHKLTGQVLHVRTGTLRRSINQRVVEGASGIYASVGTNVVYGAVHEYGYHGPVNVRAHVRTGHPVSAHTRQVNLPARSFLRSTLAERRDEIVETLRRAVIESMRSA